MRAAPVPASATAFAPDAAGRRMEKDMSTSSATSFTELLSMSWHAWKHMFHAMPYWDPYGATLGLALAIGALGYTIKKVMD
jgi:hypothetical protein